MNGWPAIEHRYSQALAKLDAAFANIVRRENRAVVVDDRNMNSLGVHKLLENYYKPNPTEIDEINRLRSVRGADMGEARSKMSYFHKIDDATFSENFDEISVVEVQKYDFALAVDDILHSRHGVYPIGHPEFLVGSRSITVDRYPVPGSEKVHPVGSIDRLRFNRCTGKLCLVELKSPESGGLLNKSIPMRSLYLKQKAAKQLTFYAYIFLAMCRECGVDFTPANIELYIIVANQSRKTVAIWKMKHYRPDLFLGGIWEASHWNGFIGGDNPRLVTTIAQPSPILKNPCSVCHNAEGIVQTPTDPVIFFCGKCIPCMNPLCDATAEGHDSYERYFCSENCKREFYRNRS